MARQAWTLAALAELTESELDGQPETLISGVAELETARPEDAAFLSHLKHLPALQLSKAGVFFISPTTPRPPGKNYLITQDPAAALDTFMAHIAPAVLPKSAFTGIHPTAVVHESAQIAPGVTIGPHAVIDQYVSIEAGTLIGPGAIIGPEVAIGKECHLHARVVIEAGTKIGNRVVIYPGAVIGSCGYGIRQTAKGDHLRMQHFGHVELHDEVEIGANTTVDRAKLSSTVVGRGSKIDNLVQIAHNVKLGRNNLIVAQTGIAGSSSTGDYVILAGQVGVSDHISIASHVTVAACSGIIGDIKKPGKYSGIPAVPYLEHNRRLVHNRYLGKYLEQIKRLQKQVEDLKSSLQATDS